MKTSRGACTTWHDSLVQHVLSSVSLLNPMLFQRFYIIYAFYYTRLTILNYPIIAEQHKTLVYLYQTQESGDHSNTLLTGENITEADVASLPRAIVYSLHRPKMNDISVF